VNSIFHYVGLAAGLGMPLFNIPLVLHIWKRKSSSDLNLVWLLGVWSCILLMLPSALISQDAVFKVFGITNFLLFTLVAAVALKYRKS